MKVISYFHDCHSPLFPMDVIGIWSMSFLRLGFHPKLVSEREAKNHPSYTAMKRLCANVPTPNPRYYSEANFLRWLAAELEAPCLVTDWDVVNLSLRPERLGKCENGDLHILDRGLVPCAVYGSELGFRQFINHLFEYEKHLEPFQGRMIGGDMQVMKGSYKSSADLCDTIKTERPERFPLVHFPNEATNAMFRVTGNARATPMRRFYEQHFGKT